MSPQRRKNRGKSAHNAEKTRKYQNAGKFEANQPTTSKQISPQRRKDRSKSLHNAEKIESEATDRISDGSTGVVIDIVFKRLCLLDVVQCRLVCKDWRHILDICKIKQNYCCFTATPDDFCLKPEDIKKHVCPPNETLCSSVDLLPGITDHRLMASAHGILCFLCGNSLVVYNPTTQARRVLPEMQRITEIEAVGIHFDRLQNCYTILVTGKGWHIGTNGGARKAPKEPYYYSGVEVFESRRAAWEYRCEFQTDSCVKKGRIAWWEGRFHWMVNPAGKGALELVAYDMEGNRWERCETEGIQALGIHGVPDMWVFKDALLCKELWGKKKWALMAGQEKKWKQVVLKGVKSLLIAAHPSGEGRSRKLRMCIYDPYSSGPEQTPLLSSRRYLVHEELQLRPSHRFPYTPCPSAQV